MAVRYASNGYLRLGTSVVTKALKLDIQSAGNVDMLITTVGEVGFTTPSARTVKINCDNAVARTDVERLAIYRKYQASEIVDLTYTSGSTQFKSTGVLESCELGSEANKADTFKFSFLGVEEGV